MFAIFTMPVSCDIAAVCCLLLVGILQISYISKVKLTVVIYARRTVFRKSCVYFFHANHVANVSTNFEVLL